ncbi:Uncharacterised protein [Salmonella enterica subsp. salamae]|nr:Uncharacterised protein [Salmonella enterica subsp. salamae]
MSAADDEQCVRRQRVLQVADGQIEPGFKVIATIAIQLTNQQMQLFLEVVLRGGQFKQKLPQRFAATELVVAVVFIADHDANLVAAMGIIGARAIQRFRQLLVEQQPLKAD